MARTPLIGTPQIKSSSHLRVGLAAATRRKIVRRAVTMIRQRFGDPVTKRLSIDAIAVTGHSGLLIAPSVADRLDLDMIIVRRPGERSSVLPCHSTQDVEGHLAGSPKYIVIDDLVCTGKTHRHLVQSIYNANPDAVWQGTLLYYDSIGSWYMPRCTAAGEPYSDDVCRGVGRHEEGESNLGLKGLSMY